MRTTSLSRDVPDSEVQGDDGHHVDILDFFEYIFGQSLSGPIRRVLTRLISRLIPAEVKKLKALLNSI